jgi:hypothetical protein
MKAEVANAISLLIVAVLSTTPVAPQSESLASQQLHDHDEPRYQIRRIKGMKKMKMKTAEPSYSASPTLLPTSSDSDERRTIVPTMSAAPSVSSRPSFCIEASKKGMKMMMSSTDDDEEDCYDTMFPSEEPKRKKKKMMGKETESPAPTLSQFPTLLPTLSAAPSVSSRPSYCIERSKKGMKMMGSRDDDNDDEEDCFDTEFPSEEPRREKKKMMGKGTGSPAPTVSESNTVEPTSTLPPKKMGMKHH